MSFLFSLLILYARADEIAVGSKAFTEGYVLAEILAQKIEQSNFKVSRRFGLGGTGILFESLHKGAIDIYPEYTGTISEAILKNPNLKSLEEIRNALVPLGLMISQPLGFNNTYALAVKKDFAQTHNIKTISDLSKIQRSVRAALSSEFINRADGFEALKKTYGLNFPVKSLEHSLSYQAIEENAADIIDVYSTDAKIEKLQLVTLEDNLSFFPRYDAVFIARKEFVDRFPDLWQKISTIKLNEERMIGLNAQADIKRIPFPKIASQFLETGTRVRTSETWERIVLRTKEHLALVGIAFLFSILIGIPLGVIAAQRPSVGKIILSLSGIVQTIPSLALLCFLIPLFGIGVKPALVALSLYGLLPVVTNTFVGIRSIDPGLIEVSRALGLKPWEQLFRIELPLASRSILAGIRTSTIVSIGTATLAALIGAGGYGAPIVTGLALNDTNLILVGAVPAAVMALIVDALFNVAALWIIPKGLRI